MFSVQDHVGALHDSIASFKKFKINMTKIESRPSKRRRGSITFRGHPRPLRRRVVKKALAELAKHTMFVKILGSYPNVNG